MASQKAPEKAPDRPYNGRPSKKVKFSPQVQVAEYHAVPAQDTVTFHLLLATTAEQLQRQMASGGMPFKCEFYNQVRSVLAAIRLEQLASIQQLCLAALVSSVAIGQ
eukprot:GHUV01047556.1.p1 GENE.GHUV01047556.1~~GHUV01047556.1.p1  ORF type:complete len:107 (+),score=15.64 GHUV01047556.1:102-422(+)